MTRPAAAPRRKKPPRFNFCRRIKEISLFFEGNDEVHKSLRRLTRRLNRAGIPYAVVGGMAVNAHKYRRTTGDVDILLTPESLEEFRRRSVARQYRPQQGRKRKFADTANDIGIDFRISGHYPGTGAAEPIAFPKPTDVAELIDKIPVLNLAKLVELKLAARRYRDFGDVVELIRFNDLDESFARKLHPSVRRDHIECLDEKRREDEYEARNS